MWNCFMCDEDAFVGGSGGAKIKQPALQVSDEELAYDIWETIRTDGRQVDRQSKKNLLSAQDGNSAAAEWRSILRKSIDEKAKGLNGEADAIIVESMLEPLDLWNEYRKICIVNLFVMMWSIVMPWLPLAGYGVLLIRFKFNFIKLAQFNRRPIPRKPATNDPTGGYHPVSKFGLRCHS